MIGKFTFQCTVIVTGIMAHEFISTDEVDMSFGKGIAYGCIDTFAQLFIRDLGEDYQLVYFIPEKTRILHDNLLCIGTYHKSCQQQEDGEKSQKYKIT